MKRIFFIAAAACACHFSSTAQDGAAEQKAWMEYATPSQMHQMLAKSNGNWNEENNHVDEARHTANEIDSYI